MDNKIHSVRQTHGGYGIGTCFFSAVIQKYSFLPLGVNFFSFPHRLQLARITWWYVDYSFVYSTSNLMIYCVTLQRKRKLRLVILYLHVHVHL